MTIVVSEAALDSMADGSARRLAAEAAEQTGGRVTALVETRPAGPPYEGLGLVEQVWGVTSD